MRVALVDRQLDARSRASFESDPGGHDACASRDDAGRGSRCSSGCGSDRTGGSARSACREQRSAPGRSPAGTCSGREQRSAGRPERTGPRSALNPFERASIRAALPLAFAALAAALALTLHRIGFIGISDDDASRTLIAWNASQHLALDPTRSSWLPIHTWELAAVIGATRDLYFAPRIVSLIATCASAILAASIARSLGASALRAFAIGVLGFALPWTVFTAWTAGVPEMPCVAWMLACAFFLVRAGGDAREIPVRDAALAGLCATLACGHRYEAWFATAGFSLVVLARAPRRAALAFVGSAALFPLAWLAINAHRTGDALDFVHRVVRYRSAIEPAQRPARAVARVLAEIALGCGFTVAAGIVGGRRAGSRGALLSAGAIAVVAGACLTEWRGGGATHHAARTWLIALWLLSPLVAGVVRSERVFALVVAAALLQQTIAWRMLPRNVDASAVAAGRIAGEQVRSSGGCYAIEAARLDFLWVELASANPAAARVDRVYGAPASDEARWGENVAHCPVAVVSSPARIERLRADGYRAVFASNAWTVLAR